MNTTPLKNLFLEALDNQKKTVNVIDHLKKLKVDDLIDLHNPATYDEEPMGLNENEFFVQHFKDNFLGAIRASSYSDYNVSDKYVFLDYMGNLHSSMEVEEWVNFDAIEEYLKEYEEFAKKYAIVL